MKKVSVIIPAFNVEKYVEECLNSVLNQSYPNIEIILIEDGSTDKTPFILKQYEDNSRVVLLQNESNKGVGYSSPHESSYLQEVMKTSPLFAIRMKYLDLFVFKKKYRLCQRGNK